MFVSFSLLFVFYVLGSLRNSEKLVPFIIFYICNPARASRDAFCWLKFSSVYDYFCALADSRCHAYVLAEYVNSVYCLRTAASS